MPPSQLPKVPIIKHFMGCFVAKRMATYKASELKGTIVAAKKVPKNRPKSPRLSNQDIVK